MQGRQLRTYRSWNCKLDFQPQWPYSNRARITVSNRNRKPYLNCNFGQNWTWTQTDILGICLNPDHTWTEKEIMVIGLTQNGSTIWSEKGLNRFASLQNNNFSRHNRLLQLMSCAVCRNGTRWWAATTTSAETVGILNSAMAAEHHSQTVVSGVPRNHPFSQLGP